jgi:soluble lytic murein transglycosylase-like protein
MKFIRDAETSTKMKAPEADPSSSMAIQSDVLQAQKIAAQVESGVQDVATAPVSVLTDEIRQQFFAKEVPFGSVIYDEAKKNNLSPELVAAVVQTESQFNPVARSRVGAVGLMQLVPTTGHWMGANNLLDPVQNISAGTKYLRYLSDHFNGDQQKIVAAYNAGPGNVHRFNGVPPFRETRDYISRVHGFQQDLGDRLATRAE